MSVLTRLFVFQIKKKEERSHIKVKNIVYYMIIVLHCAVLYWCSPTFVSRNPQAVPLLYITLWDSACPVMITQQRKTLSLHTWKKTNKHLLIISSKACLKLKLRPFPFWKNCLPKLKWHSGICWGLLCGLSISLLIPGMELRGEIFSGSTEHCPDNSLFI